MTEIYWWSHPLQFPLLGLIQLLPLLGAWLLLWLRERPLAVPIGRLFALAELGLAVLLYHQIDARSPALQFAEYGELIGPFAYHAGADGLSVLFLLIAALITVLISIYGLVRGLADPGRLLAVVLAVEGVLASMLVSLNLLWFVLTSAVEIGLIGYLLWRWAAGAERSLAMTRYYQFQITGLLLMLAGVVVLGWSHGYTTGRGFSFDLLDLAANPVVEQLRTLVFFLLFYGMAIRTPLFPMHGWLPVVAEHGNIAIAPSLLLGVKVGIYGLLRFVLPIVPEAAMQWQPVVVAFAVAGVFYAALIAFQQTNLRRMMAFAVISHSSLIAIGVFSLDHAALQGAALLAINFGLAATTMLFMIGFVYLRTHTSDLTALGGLFDRIPFIGITFLVGGFAIVGMPGTPGFDAAHLVLEGAISRLGALVTVAAALGNVVAAAFLLWAFQRAFLSPPGEQPAGRGARPLTEIEPTSRMEYLVAGTVVTVLLATGFYMTPWLDLVAASMDALSLRFGH
ncbi:MAG: NADH-quinone oxidoreductase subunit M [Hydrogenophilaceae bacterium]|nr:NADH-quinone oxidoreductase subunit M [Hydrogenophilaceae bacterium]